MNHKRTTKRTLLLSVLAMLLCMVMLVGTTFAWFTDSASTGVNKIVSGNLKVDIIGANIDSHIEKLCFTKATGAEGENLLWEPGCRYLTEGFRIANKGNLALKWKAQVNTGTTAANEGNFDLLDVIDFYLVKGTGESQTETPLNEFTGNLKKTETSDVYYIKGVMQTTAGNDYQGLMLDGIGITVVATQDTVEYDSYDNQYDADAQYPYPVSTDAELAEAITTVGSGSVITLTSGTFSLPETGINEGVTIAGNGADNTTVKVPATQSGGSKTGLVVGKENVTISNVTISGNPEITSNEYCGVIDIREGGTTLDNVSISTSSSTSCVVIKNGVGSGETVTLANSTFKGGFKTIDIVDGANGTVIIDNCDITGVYTFNVNSASSQDLTIKVTDSKLHGWTSYSNIHSASFVNTEFSKGESAYDFMRPYADTTWENCTFDNGFALGAGATGKTYTINNCTYGSVALTADNVQELLLDMTGGDGTNLRGCTIIVNGVTVTLS